MLKGNFSFDGAPIISDTVITLSFLTVVLVSVQDQSVSIPILDIIQTFLCWPTIFEGVSAFFCLWCFRQIERMFGLKGFIIFLLYNFLTFLPSFLISLEIYGFKGHFSFLYFIPFSLFIFMLWRIPATFYSGPLTDKFIVCLSFFFIIALRLPISILALMSAILGYYLWSIDFFRFKKFASLNSLEFEAHPNNNRTRRILRDNSRESSEELPSIPRSHPLVDMREITANESRYASNLRSRATQYFNSDQLVESLVAMGFNSETARRALLESHNNFDQALDYLLAGH